MVNCRSLKNKIDEFTILLETVKAQIVMGTESWLDDTVLDVEIFPPGFTVYRKDRNRHGGGVFLLISSSLASEEVVFDNETESVWCRVQFPQGNNIVFGSFYRPPDHNNESLIQLSDILSQISHCVILGGDFNLPDMKWDSDCVAPQKNRNCSAFSELMSVYGLQQYVNEPTRFNALLDLLLSNDENVIVHTNVCPGISDHSCVVAELNVSRIPACKQTPRNVFMYDRGDFNAISEELVLYYPTFLCISESCGMDELWQIFRDKVTELVNMYVPQRCLRCRKRHKPWFNSEIRKLVRKAANAHKRFLKKRTALNKTKLKSVNKELKLKLKQAKRVFFDKLNTDLKCNPKFFWKYVKSNRKDDTAIPDLLTQEKTITDDLEKAEAFNAYFQSVFSKRTEHSPMLPSKNIGNEMAEIEIDYAGLDSLLRTLDTSKATGPDGISSHVLKKCHVIIAQYLCIMYKLSLDTGVIPRDWKTANVVPVHKAGSKKHVQNYRPISLISTCCKLLEHVIYSALFKYLESTHFFARSQHGFRQGRSCVTQLTEFQHDVLTALDRNNIVDALFLDFRKAFDTVPHNLLDIKLASLNINAKLQTWLRNYLSGRKQCVVLNSKTSSYVNVTSGVPQGSVLGPLLFLVYINDIAYNIKSCIKLFADDCVIYRHITSITDTELLQDDLNTVTHWCSTWNMCLNISKCNHISFAKNISKIQCTYSINGEAVKKVPECKYLGIYLTESFHWNRHIDQMISKASRTLFFIRRNFHCATKEVKETLYFLLVRSILEYACVIWDPAQKYLAKTIEKVQNQAARFVSNNYDPFASMSEIKAILGWETLKSRRRKLRLKLLHSIYYNLTGINKFEYLLAPTYRSTRCQHSHKIQEYAYKTTTFANSFFLKTIRDWNELPEGIVNLSDNSAFFSSL